MRTYLGLALACVSVLGCNDGKSGNRARLASTTSGVTSSTTGSTTSTTTGSTTTSTTTASAPTVTAVAPQNGPVDGGTSVTITGTNFAKPGAGTTLVIFGNRAVIATPSSDTSITVIAPAQSTAGITDVRVVNDLGMATRIGAFTYDPRNSSLAFSPVVGSFDGVNFAGTKITLDLVAAAPLTGAATVDFGATRATQIAFVDSDTIVAQVPRGLTAGATTITVTDGANVVTASGFTIQGALAYGDLTVNEVMLDPGGQDSNKDGVQSGGNNQSDEFVEIINTSANPIDVSHLRIRDGATTPIQLHRFANPTVIPAGGSLVVFSGGTPDLSFFAPRHRSGQAQQSTNNGLLFNNGPTATAPETIVIEDSFGTVLFQVSFPSSPGAGSSWQNVNDGQKITANPAPASSYVNHTTSATAQGARFSPGRRANGQPF
jgi:hypothetical protein